MMKYRLLKPAWNRGNEMAKCYGIWNKECEQMAGTGSRYCSGCLIEKRGLALSAISLIAETEAHVPGGCGCPLCTIWRTAMVALENEDRCGSY